MQDAQNKRTVFVEMVDASGRREYRDPETGRIGDLTTGNKWMELCTERMFHESSQKTTESSTKGNNVPIRRERIAKNRIYGYNSCKWKNL